MVLFPSGRRLPPPVVGLLLLPGITVAHFVVACGGEAGNARAIAASAHTESQVAPSPPAAQQRPPSPVQQEPASRQEETPAPSGLALTSPTEELGGAYANRAVCFLLSARQTSTSLRTEASVTRDGHIVARTSGPRASHSCRYEGRQGKLKALCDRPPIDTGALDAFLSLSSRQRLETLSLGAAHLPEEGTHHEGWVYEGTTTWSPFDNEKPVRVLFTQEPSSRLASSAILWPPRRYSIQFVVLWQRVRDEGQALGECDPPALAEQ